MTILIRADDACGSSEAATTPVATFRAQFAEAMVVLAERALGSDAGGQHFGPRTPVVDGLGPTCTPWRARSPYNICPAMLANSLSFARDIDRRNRVRQRVTDYNTQVAEVCAAETRRVRRTARTE